MKKNQTYFSFILILVGLFVLHPVHAQFSDQDQGRDLDASPEKTQQISIWRVDEAHLEDHTTGESYYVACGSESYLFYKGAGTHEDLIYVIQNEGNEPLKLELPLSLSKGSDDAYEITHQPGKPVLEAGEKVHFIVRYSAPEEYADAKGTINISSSDPVNPLCVILLDVGVSAPVFSKTFFPDVIGPGSVTTLTFTIDNSGFALPVTDLAFTDNLPAGVTIADPALASTTCTDGVVSAPDGGSTITFSEGAVGGFSTCTVSVNVTAVAGVEGSEIYMNTSGPLTSSAGTGGSATDNLTVDVGLPGFSKSFSPSTVPQGGRSTLTFTIDNSLNTSRIGNLDFIDNLPPGMVIADPPNASTDCISASLPNTTISALAGTSQVTLDANGSNLSSGFEVLAAGGICTVSVDVVATGAGELDNVSGNLLVDLEEDAGFATATLESTVTILAIEKKFKDDPVPPGGTVELEFTIRNYDRDFPATGVAFSDDLGASLTGLEATGLPTSVCGGTLGGTMMGDPSSITLSGATIAPEGECTFSVMLDVPSGATPGVYPNTTTAITGTIDGLLVIGNMASDLLFVSPIPVLTKEFLEVGTLAPDPVVKPGDDVVLRFTVTNTSLTSGAADVTFIDELTDGSGGFPPDNTSGFLPFPVSVDLPPSPDPPCGGGSSLALVSRGTDRQALELTGGSLAMAGMAGDACTFDVIVTIAATLGPGNYLNTTEEPSATVDGATRVGKPASDSLVVVAAPQLSKSFKDDPVAPGETATLEFTLSYPADAAGDATDITFMDDLTAMGIAGLTVSGVPIASACDPDGAGGDPGTGTLSEAGGVLTFMDGSLSPGEECSFSVTVNVPDGTSISTYANTTTNVSATVEGVTATSAPAQDDLKITGLKFRKEFLDDPVIAGGTTKLRFTIENVHPTEAATIGSFTDDLDAAISGLAATLPESMNTCGGTMTGSSGNTYLTYTGGSLAANTSCIIELDVTVPAGTGDGLYVNSTSALSANQGGNVSIDPATDVLEVNSTLLQLTKEFTDDPVEPGDPVTIEFVLTNLDTDNPASMIDFSDNFGGALPGFTFDTEDFNSCGAAVGVLGTGQIVVTGASLGMGGTCTLRFTGTVPAGATEGSYTNTTSDITGDIGGLSVEGDAASDDLIVTTTSLTLTKSFDGPTVAGGTPQLTFIIANNGTSAETDLDFSDNLDLTLSGLTRTGTSSNTCGSTVAGTSLLTSTGGSVAAMSQCTIVVDLQVPATAAPGTYLNTSSVLRQAGIAVAPAATNNLEIEPPPTFAKSFSPDPIIVGETSKLTFTIDNSASDLAASSLNFTDNLPAGMTIADPANAMNTCSMGTLTADAGTSTISYTGGSVGAGASCTIMVDVTTSATGTFMNTSGDLTSSSGNSGSASDNLTVNCTMPTATISGTSTVCQNDASPNITFTGANGTPPYTFTYNINGGTSMAVSTTGMNTSVTVAAPTSSTGGFNYNLVSVEDANMCSQNQSGTATITVNPLPTATISGTTTVCQNDASPDITFTGANGTPPYSFTYNIDGGTNMTVSTTGINTSVTVAAPTSSTGVFNYNLVSVEDANMCSQIQSGTASITVNPLPTATISGTTTVCQNDASPDITFTGANGTPPYTFTYNVDGGTNVTVSTTGINTSVTVAAPTSSAGVFNYNLVSVEDANMCSQNQSGTATITVNPLPTATISGTATVCQNDASPNITFTGANGTPPYTFTYNVNGGTNMTVSTTGINTSVTVAALTTAAGTFDYDLVSVEDANMCSQNQSGTATITVNPLPTATISGTTTVCQNEPSPLITFTGANGTPPYTFTYNINGGPDLTVSTLGAATSVTVAVATATPGTFNYNLVAVQDANLCSQTQSGTATVTVVSLTPAPAAIIGPEYTCPGLDNVPYEVAAVPGATSYQWSFTDAAVIIHGNGTRFVSLDGITQAGTLTVIAEGPCGPSDPTTFDVLIASPQVCVVADCSRNVVFVDDELLDLAGMTNIFKAIQKVQSDAVIEDGEVVVFKSLVHELFPFFTVIQGGTFVAQIESCANNFNKYNQKE